MGSLPPFTTCRIGFYKTYVLALLPGSSLAGQLAASDAIPPLPAWRGRNRQPPNMSSVWFISNGSLCSLSHILTICSPFKQVSSCQNTDNSVQTARESDLVWLRHQMGAILCQPFNQTRSRTILQTLLWECSAWTMRHGLLKICLQANWDDVIGWKQVLLTEK